MIEITENLHGTNPDPDILYGGLLRISKVYPTYGKLIGIHTRAGERNYFLVKMAEYR